MANIEEFIIRHPTEYGSCSAEVFFNRRYTKTCKCWIDSSSSKCNSFELAHKGLHYEALVYNLVSELKISGVVSIISTGSIPLTDTPNCMFYSLYRDSTENMDKLIVNYIITESSYNYTQLDLFDDKNLTSNDADDIVRQILYTLQELKRHNIRHADLHNSNIFIQSLLSPIQVCLGNEKIYTKYITKIFNWNKAKVTSLGDNVNSDPDDLSDRYTFLHNNTKMYNCNMKLLKIQAACLRAAPDLEK